ncbi:hypothetical protein [Flavobacterium lipolyticum]|uniref:DUF4145 domain-containing protein n=1 Tax=Flavobacterium lipolyticum TaxID=2893754 RepID=A0ABS8M2A6_9FLAO|nr:hypothetical protein [Flavobacterium sp. F-126]MCC9018954.1 hypothetical protein [Flavobacterium sp. F-126]
MPDKDFLENYSLFRKLSVDIPETLYELSKPPINMECNDCKSIQTFSIIDNTAFLNSFNHEHYSISNVNLRLQYQCQSCQIFKRDFILYISPQLDYIYKTGQYPEWEIKMDKNLEITLGKHAKTFRKGLVCESQGYGIGAFSYYRRITEEIIDELLDSITDLIDKNSLEEYKNALEATKKTRVTQEKIDLIKDLLPEILKPNGVNPLGILHSELSEGLHANTDEACLENATHVKDILTFLINQIIQSKEASKLFTNSMKSLLEKKSGKLQ